MHAELRCIISTLQEKVNLLSTAQAQTFSLLETQYSQLFTLVDAKFELTAPHFAANADTKIETKPEAEATNHSAVFQVHRSVHSTTMAARAQKKVPK